MLASAGNAPALAQQAQPGQAALETSPSLPPAASTPAWADGITTGFQINGGFLGNPGSRDGRNFGQLTSDHANDLMLNQVLFTVTRPIDSNAKGYDFGFTAQGLYGTDARFMHVIGLWDRGIGERRQFAPVQAFAAMHAPWFTEGGVDLKAGLIPGLMGYEALDAGLRPFYTYSYILNFMVPFFHIGAQAKWHVNPTLDLLFGLDSGSQTGLGRDDNNKTPAGYFGFGLNNLFDGNVGFTAVTRVGPENATIALPNADRYMRYWNDATITYTATDKLTLALEGAYFKDEAPFFPHGGTAWSVAGYASYVYNDRVSFNGRAELFRDNSGVIAVQYLTNLAPIDAIRGVPFQATFAPPSTIGALTANVVFRPEVDWAKLNLPVKTFAIRLETRYDRTLNGVKAFNGLSSKDAVMFGGDITLGF
jgi:hypothetical protein